MQEEKSSNIKNLKPCTLGPAELKVKTGSCTPALPGLNSRSRGRFNRGSARICRGPTGTLHAAGLSAPHSSSPKDADARASGGKEEL